MRLAFPALLTALALATTVPVAAAHSGDRPFEPSLTTLQPGTFVVQQQVVPVDVVFIGYTREQVDAAGLIARLPRTYRPVVRYPRYYGLSGRDTGLEFQFRYRPSFASKAFEQQFFRFLTKAGSDGPITPFQQAYNDQTRNVLDVSGPVLYVDAPTVERWLARQHGDDGRGYTIYFINWYGRPDFRFHVYTKTDEADPDTGYNFGLLRGSRKMIAWGGSVSRTWFYDLSAGPESWTNNWRVDDDQSEYHMPPVWEYRSGGYRPPARLTTDLALVARFVAIDLLFTSSPLYDPLVTAPDIGGAKVMHVSLHEDDPASNGLAYIDKEFARRELRRFEPYYPWKVGLTDQQPIDAGAKRALDIFANTLVADDCWNAFGTTFAQLFCYFNANLARYVPAYPARDYVGEVFGFNTTDAAMGTQTGLLGFADDNWIDGTQTQVFMFNTPDVRSAGYGFTTTAIHEFGHHIGMSHPHDGYDSELDIDFGASGAFEFAWAGDESATVMHYIALSNGFGTFDRDNQYRWETAGYLNWANAILGDIAGHPRAAAVAPLIEIADKLATYSVWSFKRWDYLEAAARAREAYSAVAYAARQIGAATPTFDAARRPLPAVPAQRITCQVRHPLD